MVTKKIRTEQEKKTSEKQRDRERNQERRFKLQSRKCLSSVVQ